MSLFLPTGPMSIVLSFLDAQGLAKLAQTCRAGRLIVYRTSMWFQWRVRSGMEHHYFLPWDIPRSARHHGQPTTLCFYEWANVRRVHPDGSLPRHVAFETDPIASYEALKSHWIRLGRPCVHLHHHHWIDVFKGRAFLAGKTPSEIQRIYYRVTNRTAPESNAYYEWFQSRMTPCIQVPWPATLPMAAYDVVHWDDPLLQITKDVHEGERARYAHLRTLRLEALATWVRCADRVFVLGRHTFEANERAYKKDPDLYLDAIIFSMPPSSDPICS